MASINTLTNGLSSKRDSKRMNELFAAVLVDMTAIAALLGTGAVSAAGLVIKAGASAIVKSVATVTYRINGAVYTKAAADMAALSGTVTAGMFNAYSFFVDSAGTLTSLMGTEAATLGNIIYGAVPANKVQIGYVVINPTGVGNFVGGTTALDDATVIPNAAYTDTYGTYLGRPTLTTVA